MNDDINRDRRYPSDSGSGPGNDFHPAVEVISEYLDGPDDLDTAERESIEGHLAHCRECQTVLSDLQLMVRTLGSLPEREAPRSFALTHDMLEPAKTPAHPAPTVLQESAQWHARHASKVRWATAVAAILFVFVISADLVTNGLRGTTGTVDSEDAIVSMRQGEDTEGAAGSSAQDEPASEITPAAAEDAPYAAEIPEEESEEAPPQEESGDAESESADVPEEEAASDEAPASGESEDAPTADDGDDATDNDETAALTMEQEVISDESEPTTVTQEDTSQMRWRIAEVSLALVLALLLAVMIGLPKQRGARRR